jgi:hypothetical protein
MSTVGCKNLFLFDGENDRLLFDEAVPAAYGLPADLTDEEVLARLLALNLERSSGVRE